MRFFVKVLTHWPPKILDRSYTTTSATSPIVLAANIPQGPAPIIHTDFLLMSEINDPLYDFLLMKNGNLKVHYQKKATELSIWIISLTSDTRGV